MAYEFTMRRRVEFAETDMAGIVHFSNYFRFLEAAEHAFFRSLGLTVHEHGPAGMIGWARVHASCDYLAPLRYQDEVEVHLWVTEKGRKSLTYRADVFRAGTDGVPAARVARARWKVVCVRRGADDDRLSSVTIPAEVDAKIEAHPNESPDDEER